MNRKHKGQGPRTHEVTYVSSSPQAGSRGVFSIVSQVSFVLRVSLVRHQETGTSFQAGPVASVLLECEGQPEGCLELTLGSLMAPNLGSDVTEMDLEASLSSRAAAADGS